jgi:hypothetical protein
VLLEGLAEADKSNGGASEAGEGGCLPRVRMRRAGRVSIVGADVSSWTRPPCRMVISVKAALQLAAVDFHGHTGGSYEGIGRR